MIDYLAIGVTHLLLFLAAIRLLSRGDLDREVEPAPAPVTLDSAASTGSPSDASPPAGRVGVARLPRRGGGRA